jgi:hypothetical protein
MAPTDEEGGMRKPRWLSWTGIALCALYLALTTWLVLDARSNSDPKSAYILMQLPVMLQTAALNVIGVGRWLSGMTWITVYLLVIPPTLACCTCLGPCSAASWSNEGDPPCCLSGRWQYGRPGGRIPVTSAACSGCRRGTAKPLRLPP